VRIVVERKVIEMRKIALLLQIVGWIMFLGPGLRSDSSGVPWCIGGGVLLVFSFVLWVLGRPKPKSS
jgi:hypothetical protein